MLTNHDFGFTARPKPRASAGLDRKGESRMLGLIQNQIEREHAK